MPSEAHAGCRGAGRNVDRKQTDHERREVCEQVRRIRRDRQTVRQHAT